MSLARKYQPHYTVADYRQWEGEWELWFGTAVAMSPSPFGPHEKAVAKLVAQIDASVTGGLCDCAVYAGLDWIVHEDTVVRPDVMLVCGKQPSHYLEWPPALAIEVLSDSTRDKDLTVKRELYESQRVEHYIVVDTLGRSILWFALQNGKYEDVTGNISHDGIFAVSLSNGCTIHLDRDAALA